MPSFVLTGAPGAGKTAILRMLEVDGYAVVEEAATDVIALGQAMSHAEPWQSPDFIENIITLQRQRQHAARPVSSGIVFFDRSPVCTLALSRYLGGATSHLVDHEVRRAIAERHYQPTVFLIRNQGFVQPTAARRISFEDSLDVERLPEQTYRDLGFHLIDVPAAPLDERVALIRQRVGRPRQRGANLGARF